MGVLRVARIDPSPVAWGGAAVLLSLAGGLLVAGSPLLALDVALLALAAAVVTARPFHSLVLILLVRGTAPNTPLLDGITLIAAGIAVLVCAPRLPGKRVIVPLAAFLAIAILSTPLAPTAIEGLKDDWLRVPHFGWPYARNPSNALYEWMRLASGLAVFCLAAWAVRSRRRLDIAVAAILISSVVPIGMALKQFATGETVARSGVGDEFRAVIGPFSTPGPLAFYMTLVLTVALVAFLEARLVAARVAIGALMAAAGACLLLTYTRSAWIAFAVAVIAIAVLRYRRLLVVGFIGLVLAAVALPTLAGKVQQRFGDLTSRNQANSGNSLDWRRGQWGPLLQFGYAKPLTGEGFGSYPRLTVEHFGIHNRDYPTISDTAHPTTSSRGFLSHNDYVRTFVELGLPGLALWVLMLAGLVSGCWRALRRPETAAFAAAGVGVALGLIVIATSDNLLSAPVMLYAFAFCGAVIGAHAGTVAAARGRIATVAPGLAEPAEAPAAVAPEREPEPPEDEPVIEEPPPAAPEPISGRQRAESLLREGAAWLRRRRRR